MKPMSAEESDRRVTQASRGDDNDGESETDNPVVGLQVLSGDPGDKADRRYRFESFGRGKKGRALRFLIIGASHQCHIRIDDKRVSAVHCGVVHNFRTHRVTIHDCSSTNGLYVNGIKVHGSELEPGDTVTVGDTNLYAFGNHEPQASILITASTVREFLERGVATVGSERAAADVLGIPRTTLRDWLVRGNGA
jgi:hypothetical protein